MKPILLVLMIEEIMWREMCFCWLSVVSVEKVRLKFTTSVFQC